MASIERSAAGSAALSPSDTRREYIRATKDEHTGDSSGSAFGIQEAACSEEKAARDWTGRKEQVSRRLDEKDWLRQPFQPFDQINLVFGTKRVKWS